MSVSSDQVVYYNPNSSRGSDRLARKWKDLFHETREKFLSETRDIAIANKAYRLRRLQEMADKARRAGNLPLAAEFMEQAAKDVGEYFTNKKILSGPGGGPIEQKNINVEVSAEEFEQMTTSEKAMLYRERIHSNGHDSGAN